MNQQLIKEVKEIVANIRIAISKARFNSAKILLETLKKLLNTPK